MLNFKTAGVFLVACSVFGQTAIPNTLTTSSTIPAVGLSTMETAEVNIVNTAVASATATGSATGPSCSGSVAFYNAKGAIIGTASSFTVTTGQIFSVSLPYPIPGASGSRIAIRALITNSTPITAFGITPCDLAYSLETYDNATGATHAFVSGVVAPPVGPIRIGISPVAPQ